MNDVLPLTHLPTEKLLWNLPERIRGHVMFESRLAGYSKTWKFNKPPRCPTKHNLTLHPILLLLLGFYPMKNPQLGYFSLEKKKPYILITLASQLASILGDLSSFLAVIFTLHVHTSKVARSSFKMEFSNTI